MMGFLLSYASQTRVLRALLIAALALGLAGACTAEKSAGVPSGQASGTLEFAVGPRAKSFEVADASCEAVTRGDDAYLQIVVPAAFSVSESANPPNILSAQLPLAFGEVGEAVAEMHFGRTQPRYGASASALNADFDGEVYPMIQIIAQSAQNMVDYQCRASRDGARIELICNDALVFPWHNPGDLPGGSFRAQFQCAQPSAG